MAEGGGADDQNKLRRVRLMCPHPPRPFQPYRGPPVAEGALIANFSVLQLPYPECHGYLQRMLIRYNNRVMFRVDCAFDPYSEEWISASVDLQVLLSQRKLETLNDGPLVFMTRFSVGDQERVDIPFRRSKKAAATAFCSDGDRIAWPGYTHFNMYNRSKEVRKAVSSYGKVLCGTFSADGSYLALLSAEENRLLLRIIDSNTLKFVAGGYAPPQIFMHHPVTTFTNNPVQLLWSKCGRFLGMSSYYKKLVVFKVGLLILFKTSVGIPLPMVEQHEDFDLIAHPRAFDFASVMWENKELTTLTVGTVSDNILLFHLTDTEECQLINETDVVSEDHMSVINCLRVSNAQDLLAVALSNGSIELLEHITLVPIRTLLPVLFVMDLPSPMPFYHGFSSLSFSCSDNFLAAGATDGLLWVWCLRRPVGPLLVLCRTAIRSCCKLEDMSDLPVAPNLLKYLMGIDF